MKAILRKATPLTLAVFLLGSLLIGCSKTNNSDSTPSPSASQSASGSASQNAVPSASAEQNITLTVALMSSDWADAAQQIMDKFTEKYPNIKVDYSQVPNDNNAEYLQPKAAAKSLPDLMTIDGGPFGSELADSGLIVDLSDTDAGKAVADGLKPVFTSKQGKLFGIAGGLSTSVIYYNKKLFKQAGISQLPQNWEEFLAVCETLKSKKITPLIVSTGDGTVNNTVWSNGFSNNIMGKDPEAVKKIAAGTFDFNTKEYADIYGKDKLLYDKGYLIKGATSLMYGQGNDAFMQGKAAMTFSGIWLAGTFMKADFGTGVFMPPWNTKDQQRVPVIATETGFAVAEGKNKEAAIKLLNFMTVGEGYYIYQNKKGNIPMTKTYDESKIIMDPQISAYVKELQTYKTSGPLWFEFLPSELQASLVQTFQRVITGDLTPDAAAKFNEDTYKQTIKK